MEDDEQSLCACVSSSRISIAYRIEAVSWGSSMVSRLCDQKDPQHYPSICEVQICSPWFACGAGDVVCRFSSLHPKSALLWRGKCSLCLIRQGAEELFQDLGKDGALEHAAWCRRQEWEVQER